MRLSVAFRRTENVSTLIENLLRQIVFYLRIIDVWPAVSFALFA